MPRGCRVVRSRHVFWWVDLFLRVAFAKDLADFPLLAEQASPIFEGRQTRGPAEMRPVRGASLEP